MPMQLVSARRQRWSRRGQNIRLAVAGGNEGLDDLPVLGDIHLRSAMIDPTVEANDILCVAAVQNASAAGNESRTFSGRASARAHVAIVTMSTQAQSENCDMAAPRLTRTVNSTRVCNHF